MAAFSGRHTPRRPEFNLPRDCFTSGSFAGCKRKRPSIELCGGEASYAEDFGPLEGRIWLNTAHQRPTPRVAAEAARIALAKKIRPYLIREGDRVSYTAVNCGKFIWESQTFSEALSYNWWKRKETHFVLP